MNNINAYTEFYAIILNCVDALWESFELQIKKLKNSFSVTVCERSANQQARNLISC